MSIDFPDSPQVGQLFEPEGGAALYEWDGVIWKVVGPSELYLPREQSQGPIDVAGLSTYTFSDIPAEVQEIEFLLVDLLPSTSTDVLLRIRVGGTDQLTGYSASASNIGTNDANTTKSEADALMMVSNSGTTAIGGRARLRRFVPGSNRWIFELAAGKGGNNTWNSGGWVDATGEVDGVTLSAKAGTWTTGTLALRYNEPPASIGGGGGGGVGKGSPFTLGQLTEVSSAAGDGQIASSGLTASSINSHIGNGSIHVDHSAVTLTAGDGLSGGGTIEASRSFAVDATVQRRITGGANGNLVSRDANGDVQDATLASADVSNHIANVSNPHSVTAAQVGALANVVEDTTPQLGGPLETQNNNIIVQDAADETGQIGATSTGDGIFLVHTSDQGYDPNDGGIAAYPSSLELHGSNTVVVGLKHALAGGQQVYVSEGGILYGVNPPDTGWSRDDTDAGSYDLGTGTGQAPTYTQLTGLTVQPVSDINIGDRVDYQIQVWAVNKTTNRSGTIELSVGVNGAQPTVVGTVVPIGPGFANYVRANVTIPSAASGIATTDSIDVFARRVSGDNAQFGVDLVGTPNNHSFFVSVPGGGGSGEINTPRNDGGGVEISKAKEGAVLPFRTMDTTNFALNGDLVEFQTDPVTYQDSIARSVNYTISLDGSPREHLSGTIDVTAPTSGDGSKEIFVAAGSNLNLIGFTSLGVQGTLPQVAYVSRIGTTSYWVWGQDSS